MISYNGFITVAYLLNLHVIDGTTYVSISSLSH